MKTRGLKDIGEKVAILVDGGFYLRRAYSLFGEKSPELRAKELYEYCCRHLSEDGSSLYRIFYYDCPPSETVFFHPFSKCNVDLKKTSRYFWSIEFLNELSNKRKLAIRLGELQERESGYRLKSNTVRQLCKGERSWAEITEEDFELDLVQKGVDMRVGLDIASLAHKGLVSQVVLISGDSDFVPAAKYARREGIDFILDPMWQGIRPELNKHIDGLRSCTPKYPTKDNEKLCNK